MSFTTTSETPAMTTQGGRAIVASMYGNTYKRMRAALMAVVALAAVSSLCGTQLPLVSKASKCARFGPLLFAAASPTTAAAANRYADDPLYATQAAPSPHKVVTIGYLRMSGVDDEAVLAGFLATIRAENIKNNAPPLPSASSYDEQQPLLGFTMKLDVITVDCADVADCGRTLQSIDRDYAPPFVESLTNAMNMTIRDALAASGDLPISGVYSPSGNNLTAYAVDPAGFSLEATRLAVGTGGVFNNSEAALLAFLARMPFYSAVMRPNHILAARVIGHAKRLGIAVEGTVPSSPSSPSSSAGDGVNSGRFIPIISPVSVAAADYSAGSENLLHFEHYIRSQLAHIFTYMQQTAGCAVSGIIYDDFGEMSTHVDYVQRLFTDGGLPEPPALNIAGVSDRDLLEFFFEDETRRCFVTLATANQLTNVINRLVTRSGGWYTPSENRFYGTTLLTSSRYRLPGSGDTSPFALYYTRWSPQFTASGDPSYQIDEANALRIIYADWYSAEIVNNTAMVAVDANGRNATATPAARATATAATANFAAAWSVVADGSGAASLSGCDACGFSAAYDTIPRRGNDMVFAAHIVMQLACETIRSTIGRVGHRALLPSPAASLLANGSAPQLLADLRPIADGGTFAFSPATDFIYATAAGAANSGGPAAAAGPLVAAVVPRGAFVDTYFAEARTIGGYALYRLVRMCSPKPLPSVCYCNTAPRTSYVFYLDGSLNNNAMDGVPAVAYDDATLGQLGVATMSFAATCNHTVSSWSYPLTSLFVLPSTPMEPLVTDIFTSTFALMTKTANYAPTAPARPFRFAPFTVSGNDDTAFVLESYTASYNPFVVYGSLQNNIQQSATLTLLPAIQFATEDAPLKPMEDPLLVPQGQSSAPQRFWQPNLLSLQPVLADYIHAMASYYDKFAPLLFSDMPIRAIASTQREAELISLSFGSFGYLVPVSSVVVSADPNVWEARLREWLAESHPAGYAFSTTEAGAGGYAATAGYNGTMYRYRLPFVLAAATRNVGGLIDRAFLTARAVQSGVLAVASADVAIYNATMGVIGAGGSAAVSDDDATDDDNMTGNMTRDAGGVPAPASLRHIADVVFSGFAPEWWVPTNRRYQGLPLDAVDPQYRNHPRLVTALLAFEFAQALSLSVQNDYKTTAAELLYATTPSVATRAGTYGPFSNATCTPDVIAANDRDRSCQCTKGPRTFYVHSLKDREAMGFSHRTSQYSYSIATCGVVYKPYVPIVEAFKLSAGAIAGIAVGCSLAVIGLVVGLVLLNIFCFGRNNRAAPKDPTKPFAIVFTDIQSSTAMWARAPAVMSQAVDDHHRLLRKALRANNGYEVKTVGDSFMVAFKNADDAVDFALQAQLDLKGASCWGTEIDAIYLELLAEAEAEAAEEHGHTNNGQRTHHAHTNGDRDGSNTDLSTNDLASKHCHSYSHHHLGSAAHTNNRGSTQLHAPRLPTVAAVSGSLAPMRLGNASMSLSTSFTPQLPAHPNSHQHHQESSVVSFHTSVSAAIVHVPSTSSAVTTPEAAAGRQRQLLFTGAAAPAPLPMPAFSGGPLQSSLSLSAATMNVRSTEGAPSGVGAAPSVVASPNTGNANGAVPPAAFAAYAESSFDADGFAIAHPNTNGSMGAAAILCIHPARATADGSDVEQLHSGHTADEMDFSSTCAPPVHPLSVGAGSNRPSPTVLLQQRVQQRQQKGAPTIPKMPALEAPSPSNPSGFDAAEKPVNDVVSVALSKFEGPPATPADSHFSTEYTAESAGSQKWWHGLRVRIGVHYGMGDIRKDPVTQGFDYYGTVVNTAARVEGVGHGGQILVTDEAFAALSDGFVRDRRAVAIALGPQPLRGLDEPIRLHQLAPKGLEGRRFPPLRLHIEKETEDSEVTDTTASSTTSDNMAPEELAIRLCTTKQFHGIAPDGLLLQYYFFLATFAPTTDKYKAGVIAKLGEAWGFEKASKAASVANEGLRTRLLINLLGKITRTFRASRKVKGVRNFAGGSTVHGTTSSMGDEASVATGRLVAPSVVAETPAPSSRGSRCDGQVV